MDLLNKLLQYDPEKRITAAEAIQHKYFQDVHDPDDVPIFEGSIDFKFENDKTLTLEKLKLMIIEYDHLLHNFLANAYTYSEVNYFKKIYNEKILKKKKLLKKWRKQEAAKKE